MPPDIAAFLDVDIVVGAAKDDDFLNGLGQQIALGVFQRERVIDIFLQRHNRAAAITAIGGDDHAAPANPRCDREDCALKPPKTTE